MPPLTESGQHTLGCYINDQAWIPYDRGSHERYELPHPTITEEGGLKISATRIDEENSARNWFCIEIAEGCFSEGKYEISNTQCQSPYQTFYYGEHSNMAGDIYAIDSTLPHFMEITYLNLDQKIAAGTFEFTAISPRDTISVTSGRFDLKLK